MAEPLASAGGGEGVEASYAKVEATLAIYSQSLSDEELRRLIPIEPSEIIRKGAPRGKGPGNVYPHTVLSFSSRLDKSSPPEAHLEDLLELVRPARDEIRRFANNARVSEPDARMHVYVRLVAEAKRWMVGLDIGPYLQDIVDLGAGFGIEIDFRSDDEGEA